MKKKPEFEIPNIKGGIDRDLLKLRGAETDPSTNASQPPHE